MLLKVLLRKDTGIAQEVFMEGTKGGGVLNRILKKGFREGRQSGEHILGAGDQSTGLSETSRRGRAWGGPGGSVRDAAGWTEQGLQSLRVSMCDPEKSREPPWALAFSLVKRTPHSCLGSLVGHQVGSCQTSCR